MRFEVCSPVETRARLLVRRAGIMSIVKEGGAVRPGDMIEVTLPSGYNADSNIPTSVDLVIKGTQERIYMIEVDDIHVSVDFSNVDHEGVNMAPVVITMDGPNQSLDTSSVSISTNPTQVKIYFSLKGSQEAI